MSSTTRADIFLKTIRHAFPAALGLYFVVYLLAFPLGNYFEGKKTAVGDDFEYVSMIQGELIPRPNTIEDPGDIKKHPLFPWVVIPLYRLGRILFSALPFQNEIALVFPFALMGLVNLIVSYRIFQAVFEKERSKLFPKTLTLLYGACFSFWIFSSNVETYVVTTVFQNFLFWYCIRAAPSGPKTPVLGALFGLCVLASTAMIWLFVAVGILFFCKLGSFRRAFVKSLTVLFWGLLVAGGAYVFYAFYYRLCNVSGGEGFGPMSMVLFSIEYLQRWFRWDIYNVFLVLRAFFVDSIVYTRLNSFLLPRIFFGIAYFFFIAVSLLGFCKQKKGDLSPAIMMLIGFGMAHTAFFCFFSPESCVLYSLPALLPFLVVLFQGFSLSGLKAFKNVFLILFTLVVVANNAGTYLSIRKFRDFNLKVFQYAQVEKLSYEQTLARFSGK
jgi:hypothetical protein